MRLIFYALLFANVLFLGYLFVREPEANMVTSNFQIDDGVSIQLLSEQKGEDVRSIEVAEVLRNPVTVEAEAPSSRECQGFGPFEDILVAQDVAERLNARGTSVTLNAMDVATGEFDYRVVMAPLPSLQEAFRRLRELKSREIDSYVITQGEDAQGISLGVFSSMDGAGNHQAFLDERGYETSIKQIPRLSRGYWIQSDDGLLTETDVQNLVSEFPEVSLTETACIN